MLSLIHIHFVRVTTVLVIWRACPLSTVDSMTLLVCRHALGAPAHPSRFHGPRATAVHIDKRAKRKPAKVAAASSEMLWVHRRTPCPDRRRLCSYIRARSHSDSPTVTVTVIPVSHEYLGSFDVYYAALTAHRSPLTAQCSVFRPLPLYQRCNSKPLLVRRRLLTALPWPSPRKYVVDHARS